MADLFMLYIGSTIGCVIGVLIMALFQINKRDDDDTWH